MLQDLRDFMVSFTEFVRMLTELFPMNAETGIRELKFNVDGKVTITDPRGNVWLFVAPTEPTA